MRSNIKKSNIAISILEFDSTKLFSYYVRTNNIFADCRRNYGSGWGENVEINIIKHSLTIYNNSLKKIT